MLRFCFVLVLLLLLLCYCFLFSVFCSLFSLPVFYLFSFLFSLFAMLDFPFFKPVSKRGAGGEGDGIDGVGNNGLKKHEIDKVHRADLGVVSATTVHCRSFVARRNPRSGNSCGVGGGRQLNIYGPGVLLNGKEARKREGSV